MQPWNFTLNAGNKTIGLRGNWLDARRRLKPNTKDGSSMRKILALLVSALGRIALGSDLIQAEISPLLIVGALAFSFILGTVFGTLPAIQAAKLQPVDALRK